MSSITPCQYFRIADHLVRIHWNMNVDLGRTLPSFRPFLANSTAGEGTLIDIEVSDSPQQRDMEGLEKLNDVDYILDERFVLERAPESYLTSILSDDGERKWTMESSMDFSVSTVSIQASELYTTNKLSWLIMIAFGQACVKCDTLLLHASAVKVGEMAYAFLGKSGTGKSTHSELWMDHVDGCELLNDDNPAVRAFEDGSIYIYGTPWSGKKDCYLNQRARLAGITRLIQGPVNEFSQKKGTDALVALLPSGSGIRWDETIYSRMVGVLGKLIECVPVGELVNLPERAAVELHFGAIRDSCRK